MAAWQRPCGVCRRCYDGTRDAAGFQASCRTSTGDSDKSTFATTTTTAVFVVPKEEFVVPVGSPDLRAPRALVPCSCRGPRPGLPLGGVVGHPRPVARPPSPPTPITSKEEGTLLDTVLLWL